MAISRYLQLSGTTAFIAFVLFLYIELATSIVAWPKYLFLSLFIVFSVLSLIDALQGDIKDKEIINLRGFVRK